MKRLKRHRVTFTYPEVPVLYPMCDGEDVAQLEAKYAELEKICAELLEALEEIIEQTDGRNNYVIGHERAYAIAAAAIAKAKGEVMP